MKQDRKVALIHNLATKNDWCTATQLSVSLNVSTRTIRKYIDEINKDNVIVESSQLGYRLLDSNYEKEDTFLSPTDRGYLILKELITHTEGVDKYELSDKFFVSVSTIEHDLVQAKKSIQTYHLSISYKNDLAYLYGQEKDKRKLMSFIVSKETSKGFLSIQAVQYAYPAFNVMLIKENILSILAKHNLYINDYLINNLLLHLVITIDRIKHNNSVTHSFDMIELKSNLETAAAQEIAYYLEKEYSITFSESERYNFVLLLSSKTTLLNYKTLTPSMLNQFVNKDYITISKQLIKKVYDQYFIDLHDDEFFIKFTLHIRNLVYRAKNNQMAKNPLTAVIKQSYPLIYEMAVYMSKQLNEFIDTEITEDEISYIAFHIGSFLDRKKNLEEKVLCAVICPNYYDMQLQLTKKIEDAFSDSLEVIKIKSEVVEEELGNVDLIISTLPTKQGHIPTINVHPYLTKQDFGDIKKKVESLIQSKKGSLLKEYFDLYFDQELFIKNKYLNNAEEYISFLSNLFYEKGYVKKGHELKVLERERMSSTAFNNNVAVPHSMNMDAIRTGISIVTLENPIKWGETQVQVIVMIAINEHERNVFSPFFEGIINILSEWENVQKIIRANSYAELMKIIVSLFEFSN